MEFRYSEFDDRIDEEVRSVIPISCFECGIPIGGLDVPKKLRELGNTFMAFDVRPVCVMCMLEKEKMRYE